MSDRRSLQKLQFLSALLDLQNLEMSGYRPTHDELLKLQAVTARFYYPTTQTTMELAIENARKLESLISQSRDT